MPLAAMWCKCDIMQLHPAPSSPTLSVGHVTGDMKQRESNETLSRNRTDRNGSELYPKTRNRPSVKCMRKTSHHYFYVSLVMYTVKVSACPLAAGINGGLDWWTGLVD